MTPGQNALWNAIQAFELDSPDADFTFTDRLARENGWSMEYSMRAVQEYKKFIFLICIASHPLTPSDEVDQVWHLHLIYTESYWLDFCRDTLNRQIHHGPTRGGKAEANGYKHLYRKTRDFYQAVFGYPPPADIWPEGNIRFSNMHFRRVNVTQNWIIKKPSLWTK